jgi:hypothetical protein
MRAAWWSGGGCIPKTSSTRIIIGRRRRRSSGRRRGRQRPSPTSIAGSWNLDCRASQKTMTIGSTPSR